MQSQALVKGWISIRPVGTTLPKWGGYHAHHDICAAMKLDMYESLLVPKWR